MAFDSRQFRELISKVLRQIGLHSPEAVNLLLGTAAQESAFGTFLRQKGNGPAIGVFQMEPETFAWLREKFSQKPYAFSLRLAEDMEWDLRLAIIACRLRYYVAPEPLPGGDDLPGLAAYYKKHYNTPLGKATAEEFIQNYKRYVVR